jgi:hypothetical protein
MNIKDLLDQCKEPISSEKARRLMGGFSFDDNQSEVLDFLLSGDATESQKYFLLDGLTGSDLTSLRSESVDKLWEKFQNDSAPVRRMMQDFLEEFHK